MGLFSRNSGTDKSLLWEISSRNIYFLVKRTSEMRQTEMNSMAVKGKVQLEMKNL